MIKRYLNLVTKRFYFLGFLLFLFSGNSIVTGTSKHETDSIKKIMDGCRTDSGKIEILLRMYRKCRDKDLVYAKYYSDWMYRSFKNSRNTYVLRSVYYYKGESFVDEEKYDSAIVFYKKALGFSDNLGKAKCYFRLGKAFDCLGQQDVALNYLKIANAYFAKLKSIKNIHGTYLSIIAIYARKGDYDSAIIYIEKKLALDRVKANYVKEMEDHVFVASLYGQQNKFNLAFEHLSYALKIAENSNNDLAEIYSSIANLFFQRKNTKMAIEYYGKALEKCKLDKPDDVQAGIYNNLGKIYLDEGVDSTALSYIFKGFSLAKTIKDRHSLANAYQNLGQYYKNVKKHDLAMVNFKLCYTTGCNVCSKLAFFDVVVEIADLYLFRKNYDQAYLWYQKALELAENFDSKSDIALAKFKTGYYYQSLHQFQLAEKSYLQSISYAEESKQPSIVKNIADTLSKFYSIQNNFRLAYKYLCFSKVLADSISKMDGKATMEALEMNFEFANLKKETDAKQALSAEEIKRQKLFKNSLFVISGLLVILGGIIFSSYRKKKEDNRLLVSQKAQIEEKNHEILAQVEKIKAQKDEIERISAKLHETDQMKLRFFSNISHEIRTPLTLIINPLESFMASFHGNGEEKHQLDLIYNNAARLNELTNQILDLQKLDSGNLLLTVNNSDIVAHLKGIVSSFEGYCNTTNCSLAFVSQHRSVFCSFDKDKTAKILSNLLSNAFKYNTNGGNVSVGLTFGNNQITISVQDNGIGIPKEFVTDIFTRYYQLENSNTTHEGTGIGLAYVKELTELMKGNIEINSEINTGTTFTVTIPTDDIVIDQPDAYATEVKPLKQPAVNNQLNDILSCENEETDTQTILIVEDNIELRNLIGNIFKDDFRMVYAQNGKEGMDKAVQFVPDIVISDIMMPQMNGLEMCAQLKQNEQTCHIPIVLLTAKDSRESHILGYQSGADDYIVKPFDSTLLKLKVHNNLDTREAIKKQFSFDNLPDKGTSHYSQIDKEFIQKCIALIKDKIDDPKFSVDTLAEEMAFGRRSFFRKMKALTNMSPYEFMMSYKLKYAAAILKNGLLVSEVAYAIGFENPQSFSQAFKKHFGVLPSEYKS
jgi:signal transduction histidine kinase/AraC-like DNA-binding protein